MTWIPSESQLAYYQQMMDEGEIFLKKSRWYVAHGMNYFSVPKLVYCLFNPTTPWEPGDEIHHEDGNSLNDHPDNLVKLTHQQHTYIHKGAFVSQAMIMLVGSWIDMGMTKKDVLKRTKGVIGKKRLRIVIQKYNMMKAAA